jgi:GR25 family glycosyltransferase involved in LPS biosynthesis
MLIPTYIINLKTRTERRENVLKEFENRHEFNVQIVEAIEHEIGAIGLRETMKYILRDLVKEEDEYVLICEDDHQFTADYTKEILFDSIDRAQKNEADVLCGGVSWVNNIIDLGHGMFWVEKFSGLQFTIIFKNFFKKLLDADFLAADALDLRISELSANKFFIFPFISIQKDYGYSDVTENNVNGRVAELFVKSKETVNVARKIASYYQDNKNEYLAPHADAFNDIAIPTYIINLPERTERRVHIQKQFEGKDEFEVTIVEACKHETGALGLWLSIREVVRMAIQNDDDVIIICEDDHEFTEHYTREYLLRNVIEANEQGINMLLGGVIDMRTAQPIAANRFWISSFWSTQFIVLYKDMFRLVLDEPFDEKVSADGKLSELVVNKAVLYPFVSVQREFGYSDVSPAYDPFRMNRTNDQKFQECMDRFQRIRSIYTKYHLS